MPASPHSADRGSFFALTGRVALVTGAAQGLGAAIARRLARAGARVVAVDVQAGVGDAGRPALRLVCDVSVEGDVSAAVASTVQRFGRLDILVNNAGVFCAGSVLDLDADSVDRQLAVNFKSVVWGIKHAAPEMGHGGAIVNIASHAGLRGVPGLGGYVASKAAIIGYTKTAALELAERGIRVNCVCPGTLDTAINHASKEGAAELATARCLQPLGRIGDPEEAAAAVHFLASDDASFITGQALAVDGGKTAGPALAVLNRLAHQPATG